MLTVPEEIQSDSLPHHKSDHPYSLGRAIRHLCDERNNGWLDGLEGEVSRELEMRYGADRSVSGQGHTILVPMDAPIQTRAFDTTAGAGGIPTILGRPIIDVLRAFAYVTRLGAEVIPDARGGKFALPKRTATAAVSWLGEPAAPPSETHQTITAQVTFSPNKVSAYTDMTWKASRSIPGANDVVIEDLARALAIAIDNSALQGTGAPNLTGILNIAGIPNISFGANGGVPTWPTVLQLRRQVKSSSADIGPTAWLTTPFGEWALRKTDRSGGKSGRFIWEIDAIAGFPAFATNNLPSNLTSGTSGAVCSALVYGAWGSATLCFWGPITIIVNPYMFSANGAIRISAFADVDFQVRWPESFAICTSMLTT
jgi:HK97 family phage major capsid protein